MLMIAEIKIAKIIMIADNENESNNKLTISTWSTWSIVCYQKFFQQCKKIYTQTWKFHIFAYKPLFVKTVVQISILALKRIISEAKWIQVYLRSFVCITWKLTFVMELTLFSSIWPNINSTTFRKKQALSL